MWYIIIGLCWTGWLEWFSTNELEYPYNMQWTFKERFFHISLWPISLTVFLYNLW